VNPALIAQLLQQAVPGGALRKPPVTAYQQPDEVQRLRSQDPDFLRLSLTPLDDEQSQLDRQTALANALMQGSGRQYASPLGTAIGGLSDAIRMGVGSYRMGDIERKQQGLNLRRQEMIDEAGRGPSSRLPKAAAAVNPDMLELRRENLDLARVREDRLRDDADTREERLAGGLQWQKDKAARAASAAALKAQKKAEADAEKKTQGDIKLEGNLRKEFQATPAYKNFQIASVAQDQIERAAKDQTPAGRISLITAFMRSIDPNTGVKDQEFNNAQNAGGWMTRAQAAMEKALNGTLTQEQAEDFVKAGRANVMALKRVHDSALQKYQGYAKSYNVAPERVATPASDINLEEPPPTKSTGPASQSIRQKTETADGTKTVTYSDGRQETALPDGRTIIIYPDGREVLRTPTAKKE
jgi:hypothetical protein